MADEFGGNGTAASGAVPQAKQECKGKREMSAVAGLLGLRSSDLATVLEAVQNLEDAVAAAGDLEVLQQRTEVLTRLAERLEAEADLEESKGSDEKKEVEEEEEDCEKPPAEKKPRGECSWDGGEEGASLEDLSVMLASEEAEEEQDEDTHRKVCVLAETSKQLEAKQKELLASISTRDSDIKAVLPLINALTPPPDTASDAQRAAAEQQEDAKLTEMLEQAVSTANELLRDATEDLQEAISQI